MLRLVLVLLLCVVVAQGNEERKLWKDCTTCSDEDCKVFREIKKHTPESIACNSEQRYLVEERLGHTSPVPGGFIDIEENGELQSFQVDCECKIKSYKKEIMERAYKRDVIVSANTTWSGTVQVSGKLTIAGNVSVTILAGTRIEFVSPQSSITIAGFVFAYGSDSSPIIFTRAANFTTGLHKGIIHSTRNVRSVYSYCIFEYGEFGINVDTSASGIDIQNSIFRFNNVGLRVSNTNPGTSLTNVNDSVFINQTTDGVYWQYGVRINLYRNLLANNSRHGVYAYFSFPTLNNIVNCTATQNRGIGIFCERSFINILSSNATENVGGGVYLWNNFKIAYCNIYNNTAYQVYVLSDTSQQYNISQNYYGTTDPAVLVTLFASYYNDPTLGVVHYYPVLSQPYPCTDCFVYGTEFVPPNYLQTNTTWSGTLSFSTDIIITPTAVLTISPGTTVRFEAGKYLYIDGYTVIQGTASNPILLTSANASTWGGIFVRTSYFSPYANSPSIQISYVTLERGSILANTLPFQISNSIFRLANNPYYGGVVASATGKSSITSSQFYQNTATYVIYATNPELTITSCVFYENIAASVIYFSDSDFSLYNSSITTNSGTAIHAEGSNNNRKSTIMYNYINQNAKAIHIATGSPMVVKFNDFVRNSAPPNPPFGGPQSYETNKNFTLDLSYNYLPDGLTDPCFFSLLQSVSQGRYFFNLSVNPILSGPFASVCSRNLASSNYNTSCTTATAVATLQYDKCGECGGKQTASCENCYNDYYKVYSCVNGTCTRSPMMCLNTTTTCAGVKCWNGDCVSSASQCAPFDRCNFYLNRRCPDGTCAYDYGDCPVTSNCSLTSCPDGSCASVCGSYYGCPLALPIHCYDGTCANSTEGCYCETGSYRCYDGTCSNQCPVPAWFDAPPSRVIKLSSGQSITISTPEHQTTLIISLSGATPAVAYTITVAPVADSVLRTAATPWKGRAGFETNVFSPIASINISPASFGIATISFTNTPTPPENVTFCFGYIDPAQNKWVCQDSLTQNPLSPTTYSGQTAVLNRVVAILADYPRPPTTGPGSTTFTTATATATTSMGLRGNVASIMFAVFVLLCCLV